MRVADYVMRFLEQKNVTHIFMLSGGGMMYLVDALGRCGMEYVCCHHEQAAGVAAQAYAMYKNSLGVCMVTTGPGGTNALTAAGAAYMDSTPVLFLSGQVKTDDFASSRGVRQFGAQENDIVAMAEPVTKYAVTVMAAEEIRYHLEKAVFLAVHGRRGPVWVDIPLDVQNAEIDPEELEGFSADGILEQDQDSYGLDDAGLERAVQEAKKALLEAERPLFLLGHGLVASGAQELFLEIEGRLRIPAAATWRALGILDYDDDRFVGSPGLQANRYSNLITQGADLLIVLGSRMDNMITAFNERHFAFRAKKIIVDIDKNEIEKLDMGGVTPVVCDAGKFLAVFRNVLEDTDIPAYTEWKAFCRTMKERYPLLNERQKASGHMVDLYRFTMALSEQCTKQDCIVVSSTSRCNTAGHMAFGHKRGQKVISSMGFGSMGFALPSAVGAWSASGGKRVVMLEGDGSLQLNIQELQTVAHHGMDVKMFIFHNEGYAAIATMQDRNFGGFHVGCGKDSGVTMPDLEKLSYAYGIPYYAVREDGAAGMEVSRVMERKGPAVCEFFGSIQFDEIPKCISYLNEDGKRESALLENPFPFLPEEEMEEIYKNLVVSSDL